jgi:DNA recombination protein RmuC
MTALIIGVAALAALALANLVLLLRLRQGAGRSGADALRLEQALRAELRAAREEAATQARALREEAAAAARGLREELLLALKGTGDTQLRTLGEMGGHQRASAEAMQGRLDAIRDTVDRNLQQLVQKNEAKLEEMRRTVDEQLQGTLEKRLGESFQIVSGRLEAVHRGLGEMQALAQGVGDLRRVLTNVKARGTWAEVQLGAILEQILTPDQYGRNVRVKDESEERVEFAVRLPGRPATRPGAGDGGVWLPIDSKFPQESYVRLLHASESGDAEAVQGAIAELTRVVRASARTIFEKYVAPPHTTDFAVLFLPTEGLYAEILRQPGLVEQLQDTYRVVVAGPTTLAALLSSLRMGFRTLAIEQRASEVWTVLGAVKTEFGKFGDVLEKIKRQLATASRSLTETGVRTRAMARKLREVEELPAAQAEKVLQLGDGYVQMELIAGDADEETAGEGEGEAEAELEGESATEQGGLFAPAPDRRA